MTGPCVAGRSPQFFLDANILFSAARDPAGRSATLITLAHHAHALVATSAYAIEEARRNLALKASSALPRLDQLVRHLRVVPDAAPDLVRQVAARHLVPLADAPILAAAVRAHAECLVTGDRRHFGHVMDRHVSDLPVRVVSLAHALVQAIERIN